MNDQSVLHTHLAVSRVSPEAAVLRLLVELGAQVVGASEGSLLVFDVASDDLVFAITVGSSEEALVGTRVPLGQGLTGLAALTHEVQIGAPTYKLPSLEGEMAPNQPRAVMAAPMLADSTLVGVMTAVRFHGSNFGAEDAQLYARLASVAALVVQQRHRILALEKPENALGEAHTTALGSLNRIATARADAMCHVARVLAELEGLCGLGRVGA